MTTMNNKRRAGPQGIARKPRFQTRPVAAACSALLLASGAVHAQSEPAKDEKKADDQVQTVTVTGIRRGIESAISVKKNSDSIVEAVSAEDIGKLPDTSIAESIARLPGLAAQRTNGRAQQISIRGMSPDFSTALLNGREQVTTGDSRGVEFDQYPSELLSAVVVYKTPDGALLGQGLSGTVDMQTIRPLDVSGRTIAVNYRQQRLGVGAVEEGDGYRASLSYVDQFFDRKLGIALGYARLDEKGATSSRFDSWGGGTTTYQGQTVNVPYNGFGWWTDQTTQTRDGAMAVVQFKPSKEFSSTLDLFYSKFEQIISTKGFQAPLNDSWLGAPYTYDRPGNLINATLSGSDVTSGTFDNVRAVIRNDGTRISDNMRSIGWNNQFQAGDMRLNFDLSHSDINRNEVIIETTAGTPQSQLDGAQFDTISFTNNAQFTPGLDYTDRSLIKLTDVQGWGGGINSPQAGYTKLPHVTDSINAVRFSGKQDVELGFVSSVEAGLNVTSRKKTRTYTEGRLVIAGSDDPLASADIPGTSTTTVGGMSFATFDPTSAIGSVYDVVRKLHPDIYNKDWSVTEKVTTLFSKAQLESELFGLPVSGNLGLQFVATDQSSTAFNVDRSTCANDQNCPAGEQTAGSRYTDVLPSLNLAFDLGRDQKVRLGLARVLARPTINDMRASMAFGADAADQRVEGDAGNPKLQPFRANAIDLSYEKYFGSKAYFSVAGFYKDLQTYIVRAPVDFDFAPFVTPGSLPEGTSTRGILVMPVNGHGGTISGIELSASVPFNMLTSWLDGFGLQASYSNTHSSVKLPTSGVVADNIGSPTIPLPGLSKEVSNLTLYFEKWGFSARVAQRARSDFLGEVTSNTGDRQLSFIKGERIVDAQLGYEFQDGFAKGLSLLFQANNITDEPFVRFNPFNGAEIERKKYGSTYLFGINYKL
jgi:iron complex outermembrane recepter protein